MIMGISGKIGSGKDTVGKIIQSITQGDKEDKIAEIVTNDWIGSEPTWQIVKFADALKDIVCILTGCTREQLEDIDFKNSNLSDGWDLPEGIGIRDFVIYDAENYPLTYRKLLQKLGTDLLRNQLHENVWVNALFNKYDYYLRWKKEGSNTILPNWIITDVRFPNELQAVKDRYGITIRVIKTTDNVLIDNDTHTITDHQHISETALDNATFDYTISAKQDDIKSLIVQVKEILIKEKLI